MNATPLFRFDPQHRRQIAGLVRGTGATQSISDLIRAFEAVEKQCDDALTRQDRLSRAVFAETAPHALDSGRMTGRPFGEFRGAVELARK